MPRIALSAGFALHVELEGAGPPLVLLHGFTGSGGSWGAFGAELAKSFTILKVDIVGHGRSDSPHDADHYVMTQARRDIVAAVREAGIERACWLGYSMGGRTALHVATASPDAVAGLVLIGASPGISSREERVARIAADAALADDIERHGVGPFVDRWERLPLFASQEQLPAEVRWSIRAGRLANNARGLAQSLRWMGAGAQPPLHSALASIPMPALLLAGEKDAKYVEQGQQMAAAMPAAEFVAIPKVGHAAHTEDPQFCANSVIRFIAGEASQ